MATKKPNILIIWGDDIGWFNVSANAMVAAPGAPAETHGQTERRTRKAG
jgi:arylsulfatase A-like enzyme